MIVHGLGLEDRHVGVDVAQDLLASREQLGTGALPPDQHLHATDPALSLELVDIGPRCFSKRADFCVGGDADDAQLRTARRLDASTNQVLARIESSDKGLAHDDHCGRISQYATGWKPTLGERLSADLVVSLGSFIWNFREEEG